MASEKYQEIKALLDSPDAEKIHQGLLMIREELPSIDEESARSLFEMVSVLFHVDLFDHPDQAKPKKLIQKADYSTRGCTIMMKTHYITS